MKSTLGLTLSCLLSLIAATAQAMDCDGAGSQWRAAAQANAATVLALDWTPYDRSETGWATYLPLIWKEIGTACDPDTVDFAAALSVFQARHGQSPNGIFDPAVFSVFRGVWQERRPFIRTRLTGVCPEPPPLLDLAYLDPAEEQADRTTRLLRRDVLAAYRRMAETARVEVPEIAADPELLQIFSGWRDPAEDAARCAREGNCDGLRRAVCSPHRTGTAVDLYVGRLPDGGVSDTQPLSRWHMTAGPAYRWLVANAGRFGFVPYAYEPWHWEWTGP